MRRMACRMAGVWVHTGSARMKNGEGQVNPALSATPQFVCSPGHSARFVGKQPLLWTTSRKAARAARCLYGLQKSACRAVMHRGKQPAPHGWWESNQPRLTGDAPSIRDPTPKVQSIHLMESISRTLYI